MGRPKKKAGPLKRTGPKPGFVPDIPRAARILASAVVLGNLKKAADRAGCSQEQIKDWKKAMKLNPELQAAFESQLRQLDGEWQKALKSAAVKATGVLTRTLDDCTEALERVDLDQDTKIVLLGIRKDTANDLLEHMGLASPGPEER